MPMVLDSSVALAWLLPDETNAAVDALADRLENDAAYVPAVWPLEITNALLTAQRRNRLGADDVDRLLALVLELPIDVEPAPAGERLAAVLALARRHGLTTYDAAYLESAQRRGVPLATLDGRLRSACAAEKVSLLPAI